MLNYNHLYYFHIAALEGSVGAAATRLGVTQPTVSEQLRALERSLGTTLFERHSTGLKLSEAGRVAFQHTSVMFSVGERLVHDLDKAPPEPTELRIGISGSVSRSMSGRFLTPLMKLDCKPIVRLVDCSELMRGLKSAQLELVLCESPPADSDCQGLDVQLVERPTLVAIAHPSLNPATDWRDVALVQYSSGSRFRWDIDEYIEKRKLVPRIAAEADDAWFMLEAAATGNYVAIVPSSIAQDALAAKRVKLLDTIPTQHTGIYAIYRSAASTDIARHAANLLAQGAQTHAPSLSTTTGAGSSANHVAAAKA
jgi:DNA-binding transcriptional LysR family regulator